MTGHPTTTDDQQSDAPNGLAGWRTRVREFRRDDRGVASNIDFVIAIVIKATLLSIFLAGSTALVYSSAPPDYTNTFVADRAADRLADDYLVDTPEQTVLNRTCTEAFFETRAPGGCSFEDSWDNVDEPEHYLNNALVVEPSRQVNVTIQNTAGRVISMGGSRLAAGESPPTNHSTVRSFHRIVALDKDDDGAPEWYTLRVKVW